MELVQVEGHRVEQGLGEHVGLAAPEEAAEAVVLFESALRLDGSAALVSRSYAAYNPSKSIPSVISSSSRTDSSPDLVYHVLVVDFGSQTYHTTKTGECSRILSFFSALPRQPKCR